MKTLKLLLPALLSIGTVLTALPDSADATPRGFSHSNRWNRGHKSNNVPELSIGAAGAALALLGGGLMIITGRRRSKRD